MSGCARKKNSSNSRIASAESSAWWWALVRWIGRNWLLWLPMVIVAALWLSVGVWVVIVLVTVLAGGLTAWRVKHHASFTRLISARWAARWRRICMYAPRWRFWMNRIGLVLEHDGYRIFPEIITTRWTPALDQLLVRMPAGFTPADFQDNADAVAHAARAQECRVRIHAPGLVWLDLLRRDPFKNPIPALPVPDLSDVDIVRPQIGKREDCAPWRMQLIDAHTLIAGMSRSGKGSVIWSLIRAIAPAIRAGLVRVWSIDPKGGMELEFGRNLFYRYESDSHEAMVGLLEDAVAALDTRNKRLKGKARKFTASAATPLNLILIDEVATLTCYLPDRQLGRRVDAALCDLLSKGLAPGFCVVAALQDPTKDTIPYRDLFTHRIALHLGSDLQVDMVLGDGARDRGGYADRIPHALKGVGYVIEDGKSEPIRVRAAYVTDDEIRTMNGEYGIYGGLSHEIDTAAESQEPPEAVAA